MLPDSFLLNVLASIGLFQQLEYNYISHKSTKSEAFEVIHQVIIDGISDNMDRLVQSGKYGTMNKTNYKKMRYYVIKFVSEA